jgi:hypothetical protein
VFLRGGGGRVWMLIFLLSIQEEAHKEDVLVGMCRVLLNLDLVKSILRARNKRNEPSMKEKEKKKNNNNDSKLKEERRKIHRCSAIFFFFALKGSNPACAWLREVLLFLELDRTASCNFTNEKENQ